MLKILKINWGTGVIIAFVLFAIFIGSLVFRTFQQNIDLVADDYYAREIKYQEQLDKLQNSKSLHNQISLNLSGDNLIVKFPATGAITGTLKFFRPSDARFDVVKDIQIDESGQQVLNTSKMLPGKYSLQVDWANDGEKYYSEQTIVIP